MDIEIKVGTQGPTAPPMDGVIRVVKSIEEAGYESVWWPDHWMGWVPESIWTPDLVGEIANRMPSPHLFFEAYTTMAVSSYITSRVLLGTCVTEAVRRHPTELAQTFLTLDHISKGRVILGIGAGELENIEPYGIKWGKPVQRLKESIQIIRLHWAGKKVNYEGKYWKLKDAILDLPPFEKGKCPPIWIGAHREKMLKLAGELGDGWLPSQLEVDEYAEKLKIVKDSAKKVGRDPETITPALFISVVIDEDHEECHRMLHSIVGKAYSLLISPERYEKYGFEHPFKDFYALTDYVPTRLSRQEALKAIENVPPEMCEHRGIHGTVDEVIRQVEEYARVGVKHIVFWNMTPLMDYRKSGNSFRNLKKVLEYFQEIKNKV